MEDDYILIVIKNKKKIEASYFWFNNPNYELPLQRWLNDKLSFYQNHKIKQEIERKETNETQIKNIDDKISNEEHKRQLTEAQQEAFNDIALRFKNLEID